MENILKKERGITLIALVVTIVVLIILAGITLSLVLGQNGVANKAKEAKNDTIIAQEKENIGLAWNAACIDVGGDTSAITGTIMQTELNKTLTADEKDSSKATVAQTTVDGNTQFTITYTTTGNVYTIDSNGKVTQGEVTPPTPKADGSWSDTKGVNTPKLSNGMVPVIYNGTNWVVCCSTSKDWYNYVAGTGTADNNASQWANVMLMDGIVTSGHTNAQIKAMTRAQLDAIAGETVTTMGSMFVWIPRYAYSITSNWHINTTGAIAVEFLKNETNTSSTGRTSYDNASGLNKWNVHPAFNFGGEITGIWIAKFEASNANCTTTASTGEVAYISQPVKVVPNVTSWRNIKENDIFTVCKAMVGTYSSTYGISEIDTHEMKNSEWGAVAYLTQSKYGRNGTEIYINNSCKYITGSSGGSTSAAQSTSETPDAYDTANGVKASTTGNAYGIYDLSGGASEYTAAYVNNSNTNLATYGAALVNETNGKYKDVYTSSGDGERTDKNYEANSGIFGDAVYETSSTIEGSYSWNFDAAFFPSSSYTFFARGGNCGDGFNTGEFSFTDFNGNGYSNYGFRPVLAF